MNSRVEIKKIALQKLKDAERLYKRGSYDNAFYLAICAWKEDCRYGILGSKTQPEVLQFLDAIRDPTNGFLKWIKKYW
jgi:hypothetical protein